MISPKKSVKMSAKDLVEIKAVVHGRVQGVGFRATVQRHGKQLGLHGTVRNLADGSVEIYVRGTQTQIDRLFYILKEEEFPGYIQRVEISPTPLSSHADGFLVI